MSADFTNPQTLFDVSGKRILVTGGGSGIGFGLAKGLAAAGAEVILNGRSEAKLNEAVAQLKEEGLQCSSIAFDVSDPIQVAQSISELESKQLAIDVLINNAGTNRRGAMSAISPEDYKTVMSANVDGVFFVSREVSRHMQRRGSGKIINICSALSHLGRKGAVAYSGSKAAVAMMTASMCDELASNGIQVNGIAPGYFLTEITQVIADDPEHNAWLMNRTPAARWGQMEDLLGAAIFLSSSASDFVNGHVLTVDGGLTSVIGG